MYSLSTIYDRKYSEVASHFGLHIEDQRRDSASLGFPRTHLFEQSGRRRSRKGVAPHLSSSRVFALRRRIYWQGLSKNGTKFRSAYCNTSTCVSLSMVMLV